MMTGISQPDVAGAAGKQARRATQRRPRPAARIATTAAAALPAVTLAACSALAGAPGEIPLGEWAGQGTFVYALRPPEAATPEKESSKSLERTYSTRLRTRARTLEGHEIVELEVVSERGPLPDLEAGDRSHLVLALEEAERLSESTVLYRLAGSLFNPSPGEKLEIGDAAPLAATCTTLGAATVLQIDYGDNFVDTYRFTPRGIEKSGAWFDDRHLIHWRELLK